MLQELISNLKGSTVSGKPLDVDVVGVKSDSRAIESGDVFVAVRGVTVDGHDYVSDAARRGAVACVTEAPCDTANAVNIVVPDSAKALAELSARVHGDPAARLRLVGVTGTNGKTSTAHLFRAICNASPTLGKFGVIGTVGHGAGRQLASAQHTTPEPVTMHRLLGEMEEDGCVGVVMEVSSHAVRQQRTWGLDFEIGMLTNVTRDHLDYHSSFEDYVEAKKEFCYSLISDNRRKPRGTLIYSLDNDVAQAIGSGFPGPKVSISSRGPADVYADDIVATLTGTSFTLHVTDAAPTPINLQLLGGFSVANAVMAAAAAHTLGIDGASITGGLQSVPQVPGRFEKIGGGAMPVVVVDYSHTPDSLERTLQFCRGLGPARVIAVFGCGGDRDRGKRPQMGRIAEENADVCYVTSDNPRTEDPVAIIEDILGGMDRDSARVRVEVDRSRAILDAVNGANVGDIVAICGKGHEDYQVIGTTRHHFDDREEAARALDGWSTN